MSEYTAAAADSFKTALTALGAAQRDGALAEALRVSDVGIGISRESGQGRWAQLVAEGDRPTDQIEIGIRIDNLPQLDPVAVKRTLLELLRQKLGALAEAYDFSDKPSEVYKPPKEQLAELKALIEQAPAQTPGVIPPEVEALLLKSKIFNPAEGYSWNRGLSTANGHVEASFSISNEGAQEGLNNQTVVGNNVLARKDAILGAIKESVLATFPNAANDAALQQELQNLDLQVDTGGSEVGGSVTVRIGTKLPPTTDAAQIAAGQQPVGKTILASLASESLHRIVMDSILLKGQDADKVSSMLADERDVRHFIKMYADKVPAFAEALKKEIFASDMSFEDRQKAEKEREETKKIVPYVTLNTGLGEDLQPQNTARIYVPLPENIKVSQMLAALSGQPTVVSPSPVGPATAALTQVENVNQAGAQRTA